MAINPNIILGIQPTQFKTADPMESVQKSLALQALLGQGDLQGLQIQQAKQGIADDQATRDAFRAGGDRKAVIDRLMQGGQYKAANALEKEMREGMKTEAEINSSRANTLGKLADFQRQSMGALLANPNADDGIAAVRQFAATAQQFKMPELAQGTDRLIASIQANANNPDNLRKIYGGLALSAEKMLPQYQSRNTGKQIESLAIDPLTGRPTVTGAVDMQTTPGEDQTDRRTREEGKANRGVTIRGQDMADRRALDTLAAGGRQFDSERGVIVNTREGTAAPVMVGGKPLEPKDNAPEAERIASGFAKRMFEATKILGPLEDAGVGKPGVVESAARAVPMVGKVSANLVSSDERQKYRQAQEDWVRAKLRKESGAVIGDEEMDREIRVYFPQIGDKPEVIKQKARARTTAENAMVEAAGRAWRRSSGAAQNAPTSEGGPIKISGDDGYRMLKSGDRYMGPDGVERVKP